MATAVPERIDGLRMTWNAWPRTKVEASKCVIPFAASIFPIRPHPHIPTNPYAPLRCKTCSAVLNPFCRVDFSALIWICPFCFQRNHFPHHQYTTIEYSFPNSDVIPLPIYLFLLDTCMIEEELAFARSALQHALEFLPENALVGFVSFGTQVQVHELGYLDMCKVYVFRGSKEMSKDQLGLGGGVTGGQRGGGVPVQGFQKGLVQGGGGFRIPVFRGFFYRLLKAHT